MAKGVLRPHVPGTDPGGRQGLSMLFKDSPDGSWLAISQPMHALVSGQMLREWGRPPFLRPDPFEEVATACAQHDVAWMGWEADPSLDPATGRPTLFRHLGARLHAPMWAEGVERANAAWGPWVGLLVSRHGSRIYAAYQGRHHPCGGVADADDDAVAAYHRQQAVLRAAHDRDAADDVVHAEHLQAAAGEIGKRDAFDCAPDIIVDRQPVHASRRQDATKHERGVAVHVRGCGQAGQLLDQDNRGQASGKRDLQVN
jgi:hypothetical protein